jgi:hypothetical protein
MPGRFSFCPRRYSNIPNDLPNKKEVICKKRQKLETYKGKVNNPGLDMKAVLTLK